MHIESALISTGIAIATYSVAFGSNVFSICKTRKSNYEIPSLSLKTENEESQKILKNPLFVGLASALVFSLQMLNVSIVGTGSSGHFVGAVLLAYLFGPYIGLISMSSILTVQCLLFADGGLIALGANIFNMGIIPCLIVYPLVFRLFNPLKSKIKSVAVITVSAYLSIILGAFMVALETLPIAEIPFKAFLEQMLSIHSLIGIIEVMITLTVTAFITIILSIKRNIPKTHLLYGTVAALLLVCATVLSLFACSYPDGLEWSVANVADTIPVSAVDAYFAEHSLLPDYAFKNNNSALGTSVSGLIGSIAVFALALLPAYRGFLHSKN